MLFNGGLPGLRSEGEVHQLQTHDQSLSAMNRSVPQDGSTRGHDLGVTMAKARLACSSLVWLAMICGFQWLALQPSLAQPPANSADLSDFNNGVGLYRQSRWGDAVESFRQFIKANPQSPRVPESQIYIGLALINQQNYVEARSVLREFLKNFPENSNVAQARYRVAECSFLLNDFPAAKQELQSYLEKYPQDALAPRALAYLGDVQLQLKDPQAAITTFEEARKRFPAGALADDIEYGLAQAYSAAGKTVEGQKLLDAIAARQNHPHAADALLLLGNQASTAKDYPVAIRQFELLAERYPQSPLAETAFTNRGYALFQTGQFDAAATQFEKLAAQLEKTSSAWTPQQKQQAASYLYWQGLSQKNGNQLEAALGTFAKSFDLAGGSPIAEGVLYQQALTARQLGQTQKGEALALQLVEKWPQSDSADDALLMVIDLSLDRQDAAKTQSLIAQFRKSFPESSLKWHVRLLEGRRDLEEGTRTSNVEALQRAQVAFEETLQGATSIELKDQARYFSGLVLQLQGKLPEARETIAPLVTQINPQSVRPEIIESLVIEMSALFSLGDFEASAAVAGKYLSMFPQATQRRRAYALQGLAFAKAQQWARAEEVIKQFEAEFPGDPAVAAALMDQAEVAESAKQWPVALADFEKLKRLAMGTTNEPFAWRGTGWSRFRLGDYKLAAEEFGQLSTKFPQHPLQAEAMYYEGESWLLAKETEKALKVFQQAFDRFTPKETAGPKEELKAPVLFGYRSGLMIARTLEQTGRLEQADQAYETLLKKFPKAEVFDQLLNEWALINYEAGRFEQADKIFARLVAECPQSPLADNAKLSLAESDLIQGEFTRARKSLEELLQSDQADVSVKERALYQLVVLAIEQQRWDDVKLGGQFVATYPESPQKLQVAVALAESQLATDLSVETATALLPQLDTLRDTIRIARKQGEIEDWHGRPWVLWAEARLRHRNYEGLTDAAEELDGWQPPGPARWQIREVLGRAYKQQAKFDEARAAFQIVTKDPQSQQTELAAKAQFLLAETYFLQENWKQAFLEYQKVYSNYAFPEWQAAGLLQAAKCDEQRSQWKEAIATYERLLREFPKVSYAAEAKERLEAARKRN